MPAYALWSTLGKKLVSVLQFSDYLKVFTIGFLAISGWPVSVSGITPDVMITEFQALNSQTLQDEDSDYSDWIEIFNAGAVDVDLAGWTLTDNAGNPDKWKFPQVILQPGSYLVVFASGKDRQNPAQWLHTNFKLSGSGEYLALYKPDGIAIASSFGAAFPMQFEDVSFGVIAGDTLYLDSPTPGAANTGSEFLPPPIFSVKRGFYASPFHVELSTSSSGAKVYYSIDGSDPDSINGMEYISPVSVTTTTTFRAVAVKKGCTPSTSVTNTYFFLSDVLHQPDDPPGYPSQWGEYYEFAGTSTADYGMDPDIVNHPDYSELMIPSLLSVPTLSLVTGIDNLFSHTAQPDSGGIYIFTGPYGSFGDGWERPASCEYILPGSETGFQVNCGLLLQGGASRQAEKTPKHSFRLVFRSSYGTGKLNYALFGDSATDRFNTLIFRAAYGNSWRHFDTNQRNRAQHIRDPWAKDTRLEMGYASAHNKFAHLYINGMYWGLYNISERIDREFMKSYFGGNEDDYDVVKDYGELVDGEIGAWNYLWSSVNTNISDNAVYQRLLGRNPDGTPNPGYPAYLDAANLIDYMLLNFYGGNNDWDHHNWIAARNRTNPGKGFQFFCWDTEKILENINENYVEENNANRPSGIFRALLSNPEFRLLVADRINLLLKNNGSLTPGPVTDRWMKRANEIDKAIIAESARWGDYRRDVYQWSSAPYELYTKNDHWDTELKRLVDDYFPARTQIVLNQLAAAGLMSMAEAPVFNRQGGYVPENFRLYMNAPQGDIYYTVDGTDPRFAGGEVSATAMLFSDSLQVTDVMPVNARAKAGMEWSALTAAIFYNEYYHTDIYEAVTALQNVSIYPNPVCEFTVINFTLAVSGNVEISVYAMDGIKMSELNPGYQPEGEHFVTWRPGDLVPGVYILNIKSGKSFSNSKILVVK